MADLAALQHSLLPLDAAEDASLGPYTGLLQDAMGTAAAGMTYSAAAGMPYSTAALHVTTAELSGADMLPQELTPVTGQLQQLFADHQQ
ncbi:hypothetical protein OEZ85_004904 [Tetradesmus obliquus]|uniref:Uncharacterized protein n=1 Tax=Tetradesmus obliquus TaxID=3088 RepID=A0ABY8UJY6_TETOB|nr:hypothetical protein OEZ85_004904 [Tetradesmus obliquus]